MQNQKWLVRTLVLAGVGILLSTPSLAADNVRSVDSRLSELEARFNSRESLALLQRVDELQNTIQQMQGQLEVTQHQLELIETQQRELYSDMDRRLSELNNSEGVKREQTMSMQPAGTEDLTEDALIAMNAIEERFNNQVSEEPTDSVNMTTLPASPISMDDDQAEYTAAYQLLVDRLYDESGDAFNQYLNNHPQGAYVPNAWYWLGEVHLLQGRYAQADQAFQYVVDHYAEHPKAGDALLKLGYSYDAQGDVDNARITLMQVTDQYPGTTVAQLAEAKLLDLRQASRQ